RRAEQLRGHRGGDADRSGTGDVHGGPGLGAGGVGAVEAGGEDVREHGQVGDLLHCLLAVREDQQVPVRVRDEDVVGLAADPATHVDIPVGGAGAVGVDVQTDAGLALLAVPTAAAGD